MHADKRDKSQPQILIVDDNEDVRILLQEILEEEGYKNLFFAETGSEALDLATQIQPALVFMDMSLPGINGWEVVSQLRRLPSYAHLPIIALTAHVSQTDKERALAIGCDIHLGKPFDVSAVLDIVDRFLA